MSFMIKTILSMSLLFLFVSLPAYAKEWQVDKGRHFIIYYRMEIPEEFVNTVMDSAEEGYKTVLDNIGVSWYQSWDWENPVLIYIYRDQEDYVKNAGQAGWSHGATLWTTKTIKTFPSDQGFFDSLLPHELGHIVIHEYIGFSAEIPLWFDEGVAMYQEKAKRVEANKLVREALSNGQFIALTQLSDMRLYMNSDRKTVELFYAESASVVNFLINELGKNHFYKLCESIKNHQEFLYALTQVYMHIKNLDDLNKKWVEYLKEH